ncbi:MAG: acyl carrier protein [Polyangiaceae bacterium]|nr:acyl carrier protein [Polyangiaceae bacterium]
MTWTRERVREEVIQILKPHVQADTALSETSHLVADLGIDSLGVMEVVADLEDKFKLHIPDDALREVDTVGDVAKAITTRLQNEGRLAE